MKVFQTTSLDCEISLNCVNKSRSCKRVSTVKTSHVNKSWSCKWVLIVKTSLSCYCVYDGSFKVSGKPVNFETSLDLKTRHDTKSPWSSLVSQNWDSFTRYDLNTGTLLSSLIQIHWVSYHFIVSRTISSRLIQFFLWHDETLYVSRFSERSEKIPYLISNWTLSQFTHLECILHMT